MNKTKLKNLLEVLSPDGVSADFSQFDREVEKLKSNLREKITVKTIEDVNTKLGQFDKKIDFEPLIKAFDALKTKIDDRDQELARELEARLEELNQSLSDSRGVTKDKLAEISSEVSDLETKLANIKFPEIPEFPEIPDFAKDIKATEAKLMAVIESVEGKDQSKEIKKLIKDLDEKADKSRAELLSRINDRGGSMNRQIKVEGVDVLTKYTDINFVGSGSTITAANDNTNKRVNITITGGGTPGGSTTQLQYNNAGAFGGISGATSDGTNVFIPTLNGSSAANGDITINGTSNATKTTSYVNLQDTGGFVGIGATAPGFTLEVASTLENTSGLVIRAANTTASGGLGLGFYSDHSSAASRNWGIVTDNAAFGDFTIYQSTAKGGNPISAGTSRLYIGATGNVTMGGSVTVNTLELGGSGVTDTTIARVGAGQISVEGVNVVTTSSTDTLTNKTLIAVTNVIEEKTTTASSATPTPTGGSNLNYFTITALAAAAAFAAPSGSPTDGNRLLIRILDNATARALTWNAIYRAGSDLALPTTTVLSKTMYCGFIYNSASSTWDYISNTANF